MSKCQCPLAGYCATHKRDMDKGAHKLCQSEDGYFDAFQADLRKAERKAERKASDTSKASRGVGDTVEKITTATGVKAVVDTLSDALGVDCGCTKRREWLNAVFPYSKE